MAIQQYSVNQHPIQYILSLIQAGEIAIPEIQRPFVWSATKVRDLLDSLYRGYPIGYLIFWHNPSIRLKDGTISKGKKILIDGQQRLSALMASLLGWKLVDKDYRKVRIKIAFHPLEKRFEVSNPAIEKDKSWIPDIAMVFSPQFKMLKAVNEYASNNGIEDLDIIHESIEGLKSIIGNHIGVIDLNADLDIETVTEIFIRINSAGVELSQADFAMSKIAANETYGGNVLRKAIDYFCHLAVAPEFYDKLTETDHEFVQTDYFKKMSWLRHENDDIYDPSYTDMLRVAFTSEFKRGRLEDLVALLSGRNFETREYEERIAEESFERLKNGVFHFINETNFKRFVMILRSAGFVDSSLIRSQNAINFAYILYLYLRDHKYHSHLIESWVRRWFVLSILTGRYSGNPEGMFDYDIKRINEMGFEDYLRQVENAELSDAFWEFSLPQKLNSPVVTNPSFKVFLAAQVKMQDKGFLSKEITVHDLIVHKGDYHHIFPRNFLKKKGLTRSQYNQVANYVMTQSEINIAIGDKPPSVYFKEVFEQCESDVPKYGGIKDRQELIENLKMNCIPYDPDLLTFENFDLFLEKRRTLMSQKIRDYYHKL
ncbi:GmrSD restriction endonuclease domain-containing protein [Calditrichota bacterium GD2]